MIAGRAKAQNASFGNLAPEKEPTLRHVAWKSTAVYYLAFYLHLMNLNSTRFSPTLNKFMKRD